MYLISPKLHQYKANLHCHSIYSDGKKTPAELKDLYKRNGYSVLSITDHEIPQKHCYLDDEDFLTITGYEGYIRINPNAVNEPYNREIHLNLFARDPNNETMICYNKPYADRYANDQQQNGWKRAGTEQTREYSRDYINDYIRTAKANGYIVSYNHPAWSMELEEDILSYDGYFSLEMCNYSSFLINRLEYNGALYDKMLRAGKRVACHGSDDNHNAFPEGDPACDSCGAFTMILAEKLEYDTVFDAMERGEMYSSTGPLFKEVSIEDNRLHIECSEVEQIVVYTGGKKTHRAFARDGISLTVADFEVDTNAPYIRISVFDKNGHSADTRGYFRDELPFGDEK